MRAGGEGRSVTSDERCGVRVCCRRHVHCHGAHTLARCVPPDMFAPNTHSARTGANASRLLLLRHLGEGPRAMQAEPFLVQPACAFDPERPLTLHPQHRGPRAGAPLPGLAFAFFARLPCSQRLGPALRPDRAKAILWVNKIPTRLDCKRLHQGKPCPTPPSGTRSTTEQLTNSLLPGRHTCCPVHPATLFLQVHTHTQNQVTSCFPAQQTSNELCATRRRKRREGSSRALLVRPGNTALSLA